MTESLVLFPGSEPNMPARCETWEQPGLPRAPAITVKQHSATTTEACDKTAPLTLLTSITRQFGPIPAIPNILAASTQPNVDTHEQSDRLLDPSHSSARRNDFAPSPRHSNNQTHQRRATWVSNVMLEMGTLFQRLFMFWASPSS